MSVTWTGLVELRNALRNLPDELTAEAQAIVQAHAEDAARRVEQVYPVGPTGNLKRGVRMNVDASSRYGVRARVRSTAYHAHLFEKGTKGKTRYTSSGASRGVMPAADVSEQAIPIFIQARRRMVAALIQLVERAGFTVVSS